MSALAGWAGVGLLALAAAASAEPASPARLDEVAERGAHVMPFALDKTTHVFSKTADGGRQDVVAKNPQDDAQIQLIRQHLAAIAAGFARGDFAGPQQIHGADMPGLAALQAAKPGQVRFAYHDLPEGGRIDFNSADPALIDAIHRFFDAQLTDHARHAMPGHPMTHGR
ncbi:MAG: aspartate carbamoyltransferase [Candidatus Methylumidiphilus sp.]